MLRRSEHRPPTGTNGGSTWHHATSVRSDKRSHRLTVERIFRRSKIKDLRPHGTPSAYGLSVKRTRTGYLIFSVSCAMAAATLAGQQCHQLTMTKAEALITRCLCRGWSSCTVPSRRNCALPRRVKGVGSCLVKETIVV